MTTLGENGLCRVGARSLTFDLTLDGRLERATGAGFCAIWGFQEAQVGGCLCLDFVNTVSSRGGSLERDRLRSYDELLSWALATGALSSGAIDRLSSIGLRRNRDRERTFHRAILFREALYPVLLADANGIQPCSQDLRRLSKKLFRLLGNTQLTAEDGVALAWAGPENDLEKLLWPVAWSAFSMLRGDERGILCQRENSGCMWLFLDKSRNKSRRWCAMSQCGNVIKARRHYRKRSNAQQPYKLTDNRPVLRPDLPTLFLPFDSLFGIGQSQIPSSNSQRDLGT